MVVKNYWYALVLILLVSSCSLEKRLAKYCPICPNEIETVVEYRDTTVTVEIPGDTVSIVDSLYCDSLGNVYSYRLDSTESENMHLRTKLKNNRYTVICDTDTIYKDKIIRGVDKVVTETKKININVVPKWVYIVISALSVIVLLFLTSKFLKR
jgi:hypothetical protein